MHTLWLPGCEPHAPAAVRFDLGPCPLHLLLDEVRNVLCQRRLGAADGCVDELHSSANKGRTSHASIVLVGGVAIMWGAAWFMLLSAESCGQLLACAPGNPSGHTFELHSVKLGGCEGGGAVAQRCERPNTVAALPSGQRSWAETTVPLCEVAPQLHPDPVRERP